ncbi:predicted protein [Chaetomium globosum CBS 148.51]|uniref:Uncharacterized protein n=1 Tax=Chaetomium globosum (strain ATCC 6205 / CBS 148.51 / DSM 1962 / NBRC 6347 / NRRL 1970) TaxID=306901 RepID=Q2GV91_CHAGB|nr:uncharacterized protein CHGG_08113 [Chaetomium globosum CBS 148.51]EAQ86860.1 predicted protein [Chaetomium globosum CBS 148.51]
MQTGNAILSGPLRDGFGRGSRDIKAASELTAAVFVQNQKHASLTNNGLILDPSHQKGSLEVKLKPPPATEASRGERTFQPQSASRRPRAPHVFGARSGPMPGFAFLDRGVGCRDWRALSLVHRSTTAPPNTMDQEGRCHSRCRRRPRSERRRGSQNGNHSRALTSSLPGVHLLTPGPRLTGLEVGSEGGPGFSFVNGPHCSARLNDVGRQPLLVDRTAMAAGVKHEDRSGHHEPTPILRQVR